MDAITVLSRVRSLVTGSPFNLTETVQPFSFDRTPVDLIDTAVRIELRTVGSVGMMGWAEDREDELTVWFTRLSGDDAAATQRQLLTDASSLVSAIVRDGLGAGDYGVDDDHTIDITVDAGAAYQVCRLTQPVRYLTTT